jgi:hypothetical protein
MLPELNTALLILGGLKKLIIQQDIYIFGGKNKTE